MRFGIEFGSYPSDLSPRTCVSRLRSGRWRRSAIISRRCSSHSIFSPGRMRRSLQSIPLLSYLAGRVPGHVCRHFDFFCCRCTIR